MTDPTVLVVAGDAEQRDATCRSLETEGSYETRQAGSVDEATATLRSETIDCVVTEYTLPDGTGLDLARSSRKIVPDTSCVLYTDASPEQIQTAGHEEVVVEYLPRGMPDSRASLARLIGNLVAQRTQVGYPLPSEESERIAILSQYDRPGLETADTFDRLTTLAKRQFDVDVAFVGLVDAHEERFLACAGADLQTVAREDSICTHTILDDTDVLAVEDTHEDPRFTDNDLLNEFDIRSYLGAPLTTPGGAVIGAFCLMHDEPRSFSEDDRELLCLFADEAMEQLELRRRLNERKDASIGSADRDSTDTDDRDATGNGGAGE